MAPKTDTKAIKVKSGALSGKNCIVTGDIEDQTRDSANQILIDAGATVEKSLNKKVNLVVLGENPGQKKLDKIESMGTEMKEWDELISDIMAEGGEEESATNDEEIENDMDAEEEPEVKPKAQKGKKAASTRANTKAKADPVPKPKTSASSSGFSVKGKHVLITGTIPGHTRQSAQKIFEDAGAVIEKGINKRVELAILGTNAGPDKVSQMEKNGTEMMQWNEAAEKLGVEAVPEKEVAQVDVGDAPDSIDGMTLLITGKIEGQTRTSAQQILEEAGAKFAKSFNNDVELVVLGTKPGGDKLNEIAEKNIPTCSFEALCEKLGLEVDAEPPKKKAKKA